MTERSTDHAFCAGCGAELQPTARFCSSCGRAAGTAQPAALQRGMPPIGSRRAAAVVFAGAVAAGTLLAYAAVQNGGSEQRAVPGTPSEAPATSQRGAGGAMPPDHPPIELPAEVSSFLDELAKTAEAAPDDIEAWKKLARARYRAGMLNRSYYTGARAALDRVRGLAPKDTEAIRMSANIAYDSGEFAEAEKLFHEYLEIDPTDPGVRTDLASAVLFQGRNDEARKMYTDVIASNPDFVQAHVNLGIALHGSGQPDEAMAEFKRARELAKDPEQQERIDQIIAAAEGRAPQPEASESAAGGSDAAAAATSNASTAFQKGVDRLFAEHPIVGPRVKDIEWTSATTAKVELPAFPMDQMPPVVRNKFKSTMNEKIAALMSEQHVAGTVRIDIVGDGDRVMDSLDAKELIGAFAQPPEG